MTAQSQHVFVRTACEALKVEVKRLPTWATPTHFSAEDALTQIERWHPGQHPDILRLSRWLVARLQYAHIGDIVTDDNPRGEEPAWKRYGVRCGPGATSAGPGTLKCSPS